MKNDITFFFDMTSFSRELDKLDDKIARKYIRRAVNRGAQKLRNLTRAAAPKGTVAHYIGKKKYEKLALPGNLKKSIDYKEFRMKDKRTAASIVGPRVGKGQTYDGFYGKFLEFGTVKMPAKPFLSTTLNANNDLIMGIFARTLEEALYG